MNKKNILILTKSLVIGIYIFAIPSFSSCYVENIESSPTKQELLEEIKETDFSTETHLLQPSHTPTISRSTPIAVEPVTITPTHTSMPVRPTETQISLTMEVTKIVPGKLLEYIGLKYSDIPAGFSKGFGMLIIPEKRDDFVLQGIHGNKLDMLWFSKGIRWNSDGKRQNGWEVVDILELEPLKGEDEVLLPGGCMLNQELDPEIIVVARLDDEADRTRYITNEKIIKAWRLNRDLEVIEEISITNIECYADGALRW